MQEYGEIIEEMITDLAEIKNNLANGNFSDYVARELAVTKGENSLDARSCPYAHALYKIMQRDYSKVIDQEMSDDDQEKIAQEYIERMIDKKTDA